MVNIVISKYNENIDWIKNIKKHKITLYDKSSNPVENSIKLKNIGREGETFLYHIINNYYNLDDVTVFLQGNPFEHLQILVGWRAELTDKEKLLVIEKVNNEITDDSDFSSFYQVIYNVPNGVNYHDTKSLCLKYYNTDYDYFTCSPGAQYIVPKKYILSRPIEFWKNLHSAIYSGELDGYAQEQLWYLAYTNKMNYNFGTHDTEKEKCLKKFSMNYTPYNYFDKNII